MVTPFHVVPTPRWRLTVSLLAGVALTSACAGKAESPAGGWLPGAAPPPGQAVPAAMTPGTTPSAAPASGAFFDDTDQIGAEPAPPPADALSGNTACEAVSSQAEATSRPMDIVVVIDSSGSMGEEIEAVQRNINVNFAAILDASNIDYRVIMVSHYLAGPQPEPMQGGFQGRRNLGVCVGPPLGPTACEGRTAADVPHAERFFHFDQPIGSTDAPCLMLQTLKSRPVAGGGRGGGGEPTRADDPVSQAGWTAHLRPESLKAFIMIGDDTVDCQYEGLDYQQSTPDDAAKQFDELLRAATPELFGATPEERRYAWHSIVGLAPNGQAGAVYEATDPVVGAQCDSAEAPGEPHQALSKLTGGLRYPVCNVASYDAIFQRIATEIVTGAALPCSWAIPAVPEGKMFDKDKVNLAYIPGNGTVAPPLGRVDGAAACATSMAWYYDNAAAPTTIHACPTACQQFTQDATGRVDLLFGCATEKPTVK